ncbi:hypothetical protein GCM10023205_04570 [Yinghuangia aomiensis]|uniref:Uncharacterized protein n=1 Tax=Yinghuangia aomiensis TaxID=676205 RepID=A0ABP9GLU5_9ACTN
MCGKDAERAVSLDAQVDDVLAAELIRRAAEDQAARETSMETGDADAMTRVDAENSEGAHCAWLLAQHADRAPQFQKQVLTLLEAAVAAGDAAQRELAYLTNRVLVADVHVDRTKSPTVRLKTCLPGRWWGKSRGVHAASPRRHRPRDTFDALGRAPPARSVGPEVFG